MRPSWLSSESDSKQSKCCCASEKMRRGSGSRFQPATASDGDLARSPPSESHFLLPPEAAAVAGSLQKRKNISAHMTGMEHVHGGFQPPLPPSRHHKRLIRQAATLDCKLPLLNLNLARGSRFLSWWPFDAPLVLGQRTQLGVCSRRWSFTNYLAGRKVRHDGKVCLCVGSCCSSRF